MTPSSRWRRTGRLLWSTVRSHRLVLLAFLGWSALAAVPTLTSGWLLARALDEGFLADDSATGLGWLAVLAAAILLGAYPAYRSVLCLAGVVEPFRDELVGRAVEGTLRRATRAAIPPDRAGAVRLSHQVEIAREALASLLMAVAGFVVTVVTALVGLWAVAPGALFFVVPPVLVGLVVFAWSLPTLLERQRAVLLAEERYGADCSQLAGGAFRDIAASGGEERVALMVGQEVDAQARATAELARSTAARTTALGIAGKLPLLLLVLGAPWLVRRGASPGEILGALAYVLQSVQPALHQLIRNAGQTAPWLFVSLERLLSVDDAPPDRPPRASLTDLVDHTLELQQVTFTYGASAEPLLQDLSLTIADGDHVAIVGPSGAGKSTLAALAAGLLPPQSGTVLLGGVDVADLEAGQLARLRVLIPQEAYVIAGTVWDNVTYLAGSSTPARQVRHAIAALGAGPLVERLGGLRGRVEPGVLSAGERQLLTLVRAYLAPARLTILDEATCHLDPAAEAVVEEAFAARPGTLVVIAHRISSALRANRVLVLDGWAVSWGTHREQLVASGLYRDLVGYWETAGDAP